MRRILLGLLTVAAAASCGPAVAAADQPVRIGALRVIVVAADANDLERRMAGVLQTELETLYGIEPAMTNNIPDAGVGAILLGRTPAVVARIKYSKA